jgi:hypothetical protein
MLGDNGGLDHRSPKRVTGMFGQLTQAGWPTSSEVGDTCIRNDEDWMLVTKATINTVGGSLDLEQIQGVCSPKSTAAFGQLRFSDV